MKSLPILVACAFIGSVNANPTDFFRPEDAVAYTNCVKSVRNVQQGELYLNAIPGFAGTRMKDV